ncbi:phosphoprotein phosphatase [Apiospora hydei]|uniref:Mitochondrial import inner membrane translocase subunit TIM50 n=1 Tax=Apiospora hydei TaxID=1337664 RepID=A0ABR1V2E4_9PEZI
MASLLAQHGTEAEVTPASNPGNNAVLNRAENGSANLSHLPNKPPPVQGYVPPAKRNQQKKNQGQDQKQKQNTQGISKETKDVRPYAVPSKASGGVPNPSAQYMANSAVPPSHLPEPRRILVVIDLNGTLLYRPSRKNPSRFVERPHTRAFLDYCLNTFCVAIWSSAKPDNVHKMLNQLLAPEERAKVVAIWGRDTLGLSPADYNGRVQCYKRLTVLWADLARRLGQRWDQSNTVLVDDSSEKARSEPFNLIQLPEFEGDLAEQGFVLPQVHDFLNECAKQRDISSYIRAKRFAFRPDFILAAPV